MSQVVEVESKFGAVRFEVDGAQPSATLTGVRPTRDDDTAPSRSTLAGKAAGTLEEQLANIGRIVTATRMAMAGELFNDAEVTLGIKVTGEGQFIVAKASAEASITVTFKVGGKE